MAKLRTGLIGTGLWGRTHAIAYKTHPMTELVAVCDTNEARRSAFAEEFGIAKTYATAEELASDPEIDAVSVVTPDFAHEQPAMAVIDAKKPMLIESLWRRRSRLPNH